MTDSPKKKTRAKKKNGGIPDDKVRSRAYPHPGMSRPVVRLVADGIAPAADATMAFLGFGKPKTTRPSLTTPRRPLGYPGWALVHDPDSAALAIESAKEMRAAAKVAGLKPKRAEAIYDQIARRLPVPHLPSLYEQIARDFLDAERDAVASTYFGRARTAEATHALVPDLDELHLSYVEFAMAGAVSVKALKTYQTELQKRLSPQDAFDVFFDLTLRRTKAGVVPWAGVFAQIKDLAKGAGLDIDATHDDLMRRFLRLPAVNRAPEGFWTAAKPVLSRLVTADRKIAGVVAEMFPESRGWWWEFLLEFGAVTAKAIPDPAAWITRFAKDTNRRWRRAPKEFYAYFEHLAPRVTGTLRTAEWAEKNTALQADLVEVCLASGMSIEAPEPTAFFELDEWYGGTDLTTLVADPGWAPVVRRAVRHHLRSNSAREFLKHPALRPYVDEYVDELFEATTDGGYAGTANTVDHIFKVLSGVPMTEELSARLKTIDIPAALTRTLRVGVFEELGWPALEEALADIKQPSRYYSQSFSISWPYVTVWDTTHAIAVGPEGIVARHQFREVLDEYNLSVIYSGGRFLVNHGWNPQVAYWSDDPGDTFEAPSPGDHLRPHFGFVPIDADGVRAGWDGPLAPGRRDLAEFSGHPTRLVSDGETTWMYDSEEGYRPFGPDGRVTDGAPPAITTVPAPEGRSVNFDRTWLLKLPEGVSGPLGDGLLGAAVFHLADYDSNAHTGAERYTTFTHLADGRDVSWSSPRDDVWYPLSHITLPGGPELVLGSQQDRLGLFDPATGDRHWTVTTGEFRNREGGAISSMVPPFALWHFLTPRSPEASARLRVIEDAVVGGLFAGKDEDLPALVETVLAPGHELLAEGLTRLIAHARNLVGRRNNVAKIPVIEPPVHDLDRYNFQTGLEGFANIGWVNDSHPLLPHFDWISGLLAGNEPKRPKDAWRMPTRWERLLGRMEGIAWRAAQPFTPEKHRAAMLEFLEHMAGTVFAEPEATFRISDVNQGAYESKKLGEVTIDGDTVHVRYDGDLVISRGEAAPKSVIRSREVTTGWATAERLLAFVGLLREQGPIAWDPAVPEALAKTTGQNTGAATWLLASVPPFATYPRDAERDKAVKDAFALSPVAFKTGRTDSSIPGGTDLIDLFTGTLPDDPATLWTADGPAAVARRLADNYVAARGRQMTIPEETLALLADHFGGAMGNVLRDLTVPETVKYLNTDAEDHVILSRYGYVEVAGRGQALTGSITNILMGLRAAYMLLPGGDPVRALVAKSVRLLRERLNAPGLLLSAGYQWMDDEQATSLRDSITAPAYVGRDGKPVKNSRDLGPAIIVFADNRVSVILRPARMDDGEASRLARSIVGGHDPLHMLEQARAEGIDTILDRLDADMPDGAYETNPLVCVPDLVAEVTEALGLGEDAAVAYLQIIALAAPTDRNLKVWNGWPPARIKKAQKALVDAGLLIEATRPRAGRKVFVPGPWVQVSSPGFPHESYKAGLYDEERNRLLPGQSLPGIFTTAWTMHKEGSLPR